MDRYDYTCLLIKHNWLDMFNKDAEVRDRSATEQLRLFNIAIGRPELQALYDKFKDEALCLGQKL